MTTQRSAVAPPVRPEERIGATISNKWRVESLLGVGGMGAVFAARHRNGNRVALKILHGTADAEQRARFVREGYLANAVDHPNVVVILDDGVTGDGAPFLVMEQLCGRTLDVYAEPDGPRLSLAHLADHMETLLSVLERAHASGIVHRDLKPENLFLTTGGTLKVLDFGIARAGGALAAQWSTRKNLILGTPGFMAPEQACAASDAIDARTDLWAVGATMFALLSGQPVHPARTVVEAVLKAAMRPARPLREVAPGVPGVLAAVVDRALAFHRHDRWKSASAMREALRDAADEAIPASAARWNELCEAV